MSKYVHDSKNSKIGRVSATYAPIKQTCPDTCELKGHGCYAELSFVGMINRKLESQATGMSKLEVAKAEAAAIDVGKVTDNRPLRIHVSGDCTTISGAEVVSAAARRFTQRGGGKVWSYTHAWRNVPRSAWEGVSILASVKGTGDILEARAQGYAAAIVVPEHKSKKRYRVGNFKFIPCPAQTFDVTCVDCRLCFNADGLLERKLGIAFAVHGSKTKSLKKHLRVIR